MAFIKKMTRKNNFSAVQIVIEKDKRMARTQKSQEYDARKIS